MVNDAGSTKDTLAYMRAAPFESTPMPNFVAAILARPDKVRRPRSLAGTAHLPRQIDGLRRSQRGAWRVLRRADAGWAARSLRHLAMARA